MNWFRAALLFLAIIAAFGVPAALFHPDSPLPDEWHPFEPLSISDPVTPLTAWKLRNAQQDPQLCLQVVEGEIDFETLEDKIDSEFCGIAPRLRVQRIGRSRLSSLETTCATALTTAMWERHSVQPMASEILGSEIDEILHIGSYSCRMIRTPSGSGSNWSTHARALALDISGFRTADGRKIDLLSDWGSTSPNSEFLKTVRDDACDWFGLTLSPDFNALHADHLHLQVEGWGGCR